jgi:alpha-L-fucosidase
MTMNRFRLLALSICTFAVAISVAIRCDRANAAPPPPQTEQLDLPITEGPYKPDWKSLAEKIQGRAPAWFRQAKVGMWLHWGPQAMGRSGDWYAKFMYAQHDDWNRNNGYQNHLRDFGHPTVEGCKDVLHRWKAAKWDPEKLMDLYYKAGARYVLAQGGHHDNFDLWDSKFQPWNSVRVGPHKDIVGLWQKAA